MDDIKVKRDLLKEEFRRLGFVSGSPFFKEIDGMSIEEMENTLKQLKILAERPDIKEALRNPLWRFIYVSVFKARQFWKRITGRSKRSSQK